MRILVAVEDPDFRHFVESTLPSWNYEVSLGRDGNHSWEILSASPPPPLAILDSDSASGSGLELCKKLRKLGSASLVYVVMLIPASSEISRATEAGADDCLVKPFTEKELRLRLFAGRRTIELRDALQNRSIYDALTSVWSRTMTLESLERELMRARRDSGPTAVMIADVSQFKKINEQYGGVAGDAVLQEVATRLKKSLRAYDGIGRYAGDQFLIYLPDCDIYDAMQLANRLKKTIAEKNILTNSGNVSASISIGLTVNDDSAGINVRETLALAALALQRAKQAGPNTVELAK